VTPIGDQGADIARIAALKAGLPDTVAGVQLNRFCASGLEAVNIAAQKIASGWEELVFAGGVASMSRVPMGSDGGAWMMDPETSFQTSFVPQGIGADLIATLDGFSREDVDAYAARSQQRAATAQAEGRFARSVIPVCDVNGHLILDHDELVRPTTTVETLGRLRPAFQAMGEMGGFDAVALQKYHWVERIDHVLPPATPSASSTVPRCSPSATSGPARSWACGRGHASSRPRSRGPIRPSCSQGRRPPVTRHSARQASRPPSSTSSRSTRRSLRWCPGSSGSLISTLRA